MFGTTSLTSLLDQQASVLRTRLKGVHDGDVEAVHDARVATRRIRELLALVPAVPGRDSEDAAAKGYKKVGRALGQVRNVDVQIALIRNLEDHAPHTGPSLLLVRQEHERRRLRKARSLIKALERIEVAALIQAVADVHPSGVRQRLTESGWTHQLRRLLVERACTALEAIDHATGIYFPRRAHGARIAVKQLRYAAEIAQATRLAEMETAVRSLRKGQEILGDLHDRHQLADSLAGYGKDDGVDRDHIHLLRQVLDGEVLQLHGQYLARRDALRAACAEIEATASRGLRPRRSLAVGAALAASAIVYGRTHSARDPRVVVSLRDPGIDPRPDGPGSLLLFQNHRVALVAQHDVRGGPRPIRVQELQLCDDRRGLDGGTRPAVVHPRILPVAARPAGIVSTNPGRRRPRPALTACRQSWRRCR